MAKQIKLTDKVWWKLKLRAEQDGLTLAGEIQKLVDAETLPDLVERLEQVAERLETNTPVSASVPRKAVPNFMKDAARKMGYDV